MKAAQRVVDITIDASKAFADACRASGLRLDGPAIGDGRIHRVYVDGDKRATSNGYYVLHLDGIPVGAFGSWRGNWCRHWRAVAPSTSPLERSQVWAELAAARERRQQEQARTWATAQRHAEAVWRAARAADEFHPYLVRKAVGRHAIRQCGATLVVPMRDSDGALWGLQKIFPDGTKRFLKSARKKGLFHWIGEQCSSLCIAEGYATAASIHEVTGRPAAVAFDCGNLLPVARAIRARFPRARIVLCADNDAGTLGNPGLSYAQAAADAIGGVVALPPAGFCDFNDATHAGAGWSL